MIRHLLIGVGLFVAFLSSATAEDRITASEITSILEGEGYAVQQYTDEMVAVVVGDQVILVGVDGMDGDVSYLTYVPQLSLRELGLEFLNDF
ncbi:MAG: hypothetical protein AAF527_11735, partial [Pseudomonadota bacterium]